MSAASPPLRSGLELWKGLVATAGLQLEGGDLPAYDDAFLAELQEDLFPDQAGDFEELLKQHKVGAERLLSAVFRALSPYPRMAADILAMFELAATQASSLNLQVAVDIDAVEGSLKFDLAHFREIVRRTQSVTRLVRRRAWGPDTAGSVSNALQKSGIAFWAPDTPLQDVADPQALQGFADMRGAAFPSPPRPPISGVAEYDALIEALWPDFQAFQHAMREVFGAYQKVTLREELAEGHGGWSWWMLRHAGHDRWPLGPVEDLWRLGEALARDPTDQRLLGGLAAIRDAVAAFTLPPAQISVQEEVLEEFLNLPVWRHRHELYAVWVASFLTAAARPYGIRFHLQDGVLAFPFHKVKVATIGPPDRPALELWSELRTPAIDPFGDRQGVQPDFRLRAPFDEGVSPWTGDPDFLVIECKQHQRPSNRDFAEILTSYAHSSPYAHVLLVNYGPVSPRALMRTDPAVQDRCAPIGRVFPGGEGLPAAPDYVRTMLLALMGPPPADDWIISTIVITLRWLGEGVDLDLHVTTAEGASGYGAPSGLAEVEFFSDERGETDGDHEERMEIRPRSSERFDIVIQAFGGADHVGDVQPQVEIAWRLSDGTERQWSGFLSPARHKDWHLGAFHKGLPSFHLIDRPAEHFRANQAWSSLAMGVAT